MTLGTDIIMAAVTRFTAAADIYDVQPVDGRVSRLLRRGCAQLLLPHRGVVGGDGGGVGIGGRVGEIVLSFVLSSHHGSSLLLVTLHATSAM